MLNTKSFSLLIPTFKEAHNIPILVEKINNLDLNNYLFEVIFIDDMSDDGSVEIITELKQKFSWLKIAVRCENPGLSQSIIHGIGIAKYPIIVVMDADLSHPPDKIIELIRALEDHSIDMAIGSRYIKGGSVDRDWSTFRKIISWCAASLVRLFTQVNVQDPLSGFIALRKNLIYRPFLIDPIGWKIGLEILIKCNCKNIKEIPIHFTDRKFGDSKLSLRVIFIFLIHLKKLMLFKMKHHFKVKESI